MKAVSTVDGAHMIEHKVETVNVAAFILNTVERYQPKTVFVKMDIEGTEYHVMPHMMQHGVFCQKVVTAMVIEWHGRARRNSTLNQDTMLQQLEQTECDSTEIVVMDDETFLLDNKDLPEGCR